MNELAPIDWIGRKTSGGKSVRVAVATYHDAKIAVAERLRCGIEDVEVRVVRAGDGKKAVAAE